jgi:hypothetical protein
MGSVRHESALAPRRLTPNCALSKPGARSSPTPHQVSIELQEIIMKLEKIWVALVALIGLSMMLALPAQAADQPGQAGYCTNHGGVVQTRIPEYRRTAARSMFC